MVANTGVGARRFFPGSIPRPRWLLHYAVDCIAPGQGTGAPLFFDSSFPRMGDNIETGVTVVSRVNCIGPPCSALNVFEGRARTR